MSDLKKNSCQFLSVSIKKRMESNAFNCLTMLTGNEAQPKEKTSMHAESINVIADEAELNEFFFCASLLWQCSGTQISKILELSLIVELHAHLCTTDLHRLLSDCIQTI
jgi:hypothetical protein